jgi:hypothetical protein
MAHERFTAGEIRKAWTRSSECCERCVKTLPSRIEAACRAGARGRPTSEEGG